MREQVVESAKTVEVRGMAGAVSMKLHMFYALHLDLYRPSNEGVTSSIGTHGPGRERRDPAERWPCSPTRARDQSTDRCGRSASSRAPSMAACSRSPGSGRTRLLVCSWRCGGACRLSWSGCP